MSIGPRLDVNDPRVRNSVHRLFPREGTIPSSTTASRDTLMPAPKTKTASANGAAGKGKPTKPLPSPAASGTVTPIPPPKVDEQLDTAAAAVHAGRPDKAVYDAEQDGVKKEIEALQVKLVCIIAFLQAV